MDFNAKTNPGRESRLQQLEEDKVWDVLIIGGGATGAGIAVDAAAREVVLPSQHPLRVLRAYAARREGDVRSAWEAGALRLSVLVPRADSCLRSQK